MKQERVTHFPSSIPPHPKLGETEASATSILTSGPAVDSGQPEEDWKLWELKFKLRNKKDSYLTIFLPETRRGYKWHGLNLLPQSE
jgi:hypothetical protein